MGTMNKFALAGGHEKNALVAPLHVDNMLLSTSAEAYTIPTGTKIIVFSANKDFWACWDGNDAAIPADEVADGTGSELNPTTRGVEGLTTVSLIGSAADTLVSIACYG